MLIWILAFVLFGLTALAYFFLGAVRALFGMAGLIVAASLALPLSPLISPLFKNMENPFWGMFLPPLIVFLLISFIFMGLSFVAHHKVLLYYKYRTDDFQRRKWERLNQHAGAALGLVLGGGYFFLVCLLVYVFGYFTVQVSAGDDDPAPLRVVNSLRIDLADSGMDQVVAKFDKSPPEFYKLSDILGLIHHNPLLHNRLSHYPPFILFSENETFQEIARDSTLMNSLNTRASIAEILQDSKIQSLLKDPFFLMSLHMVELDDLEEYLRTGRSPQYADETILGRWEVDPDSLVVQVRRIQPNMTASELIALRNFASILSGLTLTATIHNQVLFNFNDPTAPAQADPDVFDPWADPYGQPARPAPQAPAQPSPQSPFSAYQFTGEGEWRSLGAGMYQLVFTQEGGQQIISAEASEDTLVLSADGRVLVFVRSL